MRRPVLHPAHPLAAITLLLLLAGQASAATALALEYGASPLWTSCPSGGTTTIPACPIGVVSYVQLGFVNNGATTVGRGPLVVSGLSGCVVPWNPAGSAVLPPANTGSCEIGVRPSAAAWSFTVTFALTGDTAASYTHTFTASGGAIAAVPQKEVSSPYPGATGHYASSPITPTDNSQGVVGEPWELAYRITSRSAQQDLIFSASTWYQVAGAPNSTTDISGPLPASLGLDQGITSIVRITPLAAGNYQSIVGFQSSDGDFSLHFSGTASYKARLSVFNGTQQLAAGVPRISVPGAALGVSRRLAFTLRNDDTAALAYSASLGAVVGCIVATVTAPKSPLAVGEQTIWELSLTPTAADWQFQPTAAVSSPASRNRSWLVLGDASYPVYAAPPVVTVPATPAAGDSKSSKCGVGAGLGAWMLLAFGGMGAALSRRRRS